MLTDKFYSIISKKSLCYSLHQICATEDEYEPLLLLVDLLLMAVDGPEELGEASVALAYLMVYMADILLRL